MCNTLQWNTKHRNTACDLCVLVYPKKFRFFIFYLLHFLKICDKKFWLLKKLVFTKTTILSVNYHTDVKSAYGNSFFNSKKEIKTNFCPISPVWWFWYTTNSDLENALFMPALPKTPHYPFPPQWTLKYTINLYTENRQKRNKKEP